MKVAGRIRQLLYLCTAPLALATIVFTVLNREQQEGLGLVYPLSVSGIAIAFSIVGAVLTLRSPTDPKGWYLEAAGLLISGAALSSNYAAYTTLTMPGSLPGEEPMGWPVSWLWCLPILSVGTLLVLRCAGMWSPSRRWRESAEIVVANTLAAAVGIVIVSNPGVDLGGEFALAASCAVVVVLDAVRPHAALMFHRLVPDRSEPTHEILSRLCKMYATTSIETVGPGIARALTEATRAVRGEVWIIAEGQPRLRATHPPGTATPSETSEPFPARLPPDSRTHAITEVRDQDGLVGAIAITKMPGDPVTERDLEIMTNLAARTVIAFRGAAQATELREARRRIVTTRDAERRRLERDLHDSAQQPMVAIALKARLASDLLAQGDTSQAARLLDELGSETELTLDALRDLAHGIFPAVLADKGLVRALQAHVDKYCPTVDFKAETIHRRFAPDVEAAVYFCCREALQNAVKHAPESAPQLRLACNAGVLEFSVSDTGPGFDLETVGPGAGLHNMTDRIEAIGGSLDIQAAPGAGTIVRGRVLVTDAGRDPVRGTLGEPEDRVPEESV